MKSLSLEKARAGSVTIKHANAAKRAMLVIREAFMPLTHAPRSADRLRTVPVYGNW